MGGSQRKSEILAKLQDLKRILERGLEYEPIELVEDITRLVSEESDNVDSSQSFCSNADTASHSSHSSQEPSSPRSSNRETAEVAVQVDHMFDDIDEYTEQAVDSDVDELEELMDVDCVIAHSPTNPSTPRVVGTPRVVDNSSTPRTHQATYATTPRGTSPSKHPLMSPSSGFWKVADATEDRIKAMESRMSSLHAKVEGLKGKNQALRSQVKKLRAQKGVVGRMGQVQVDSQSSVASEASPEVPADRTASSDSEIVRHGSAGTCASESKETVGVSPDLDSVAGMDLREWMLTPRQSQSHVARAPPAVKSLHVF